LADSLPAGMEGGARPTPGGQHASPRLIPAGEARLGLTTPSSPTLQRRVGVLQLLDSLALEFDGNGEFGDNGLPAPAVRLDGLLLARFQASLTVSEEGVAPDGDEGAR